MHIKDNLVGIQLTHSTVRPEYRIDIIYQRTVNDVVVEYHIQTGRTMTRERPASVIRGALETLYVTQIRDIWEKTTVRDITILYSLAPEFSPKDIVRPSDLWIKTAER